MEDRFKVIPRPCTSVVCVLVVMEILKGIGVDFDRLRASLNGIRSRGLILTQEQHIHYTGECTKLRYRLKQVQSNNVESIPASELARREVLITNLDGAIRDACVDKFLHKLPNSNAGTSSSSSSSVSGGVSGASGGGGGGGTCANDTVGNDINNPMAMELSGSGLMMYSQARINEQDLIIAEIGTGVQRMHQQAIDIGDEANIQNSLLSNLDESVEAGAEALREEAQHAETVRKKSKMCKLYMCIIVELMVLMSITLLYINHGK